MKTLAKKRPRIVLTAACLLLLTSQSSAFALTPEGFDVNLVDTIKSQENSFQYKIENRPDPFIPFISEKAATAKMEDVLPVEEHLTGMQLFEPGQLNLVAIIMAENKDFAMAEDFTGKGYILRRGMLIGKRGIVTDIETNQVVIEETAFTRAGKKLTSKVVMLLKKEGEE